MALNLNVGPRATLKRRTCELAQLWLIIRLDGTEYRFTSYDERIDRPQRTGYGPGPGITGFANRRETGLADRTTELAGLIDRGQSFYPGITTTALESGRLWGASVQQITCNPMWPWKLLTFNDWDIAGLDFDDVEWRMKLVGITGRTKQKHGDIMGRLCQNTLGVNDGKRSFCPVNTLVWPLLVTASTVLGSPTPTKTTISVQKGGGTGFTNAVHFVNEYFSRGFVRITSGPNAGLEELIEQSLFVASGTQQLTLQRPMPFLFTAGDSIDVTVGCDKLPLTCRDKFSALQGIGGIGGFRGFPDMQGIDAVIRSPWAS